MNEIKKENKSSSLKKSMIATFSLLFGLIFVLVIAGCLPTDPTGPTELTDLEAVTVASDELRISYAEGDSASAVTADLTLPTSVGSNGVSVSWESSHEAIISIDGKVTLPATITDVTLTATLIKGSASDRKEFLVTVQAISDVDAVAAAKAALLIAYIPGDSATNVTANVTLVTSGIIGVAISWESSETSIIATDGIVTRANENTNITLTATLTKGSVSDTKVFTLTVQAISDADAVAAAKDALLIVYASGDNASSVTVDVTLVTSGANGVAISWDSDNESVIATNGTVTRSSSNVVVNLTATLTKGSSASDTKEFRVTVIEERMPITFGAARIFADAASVVDVGQITVSEMGTYNGGGAGALTLIINSSDGDDSLEHLNVQESGDGAGNGFAGFNWQFSDNYSLTAEANTAVKFSVRVAAGGPTSFGVALETPGGVGDTRENQARKPVTFAADGTWQQVTIPISDFTSIANRDINAGGGLFRGNNFDPTSISVVVFSLDEAVADSSTAINIDIDEVQFVILSEDKAAVLAARDALEITYAAGDNASSVTADVTLSTSGANGVGITWASDNETVISTSGTVTRTNENIEVTLTATLEKNGEFDTKVFIVTVTADGVVVAISGAGIIYADADAIADVGIIALSSGTGELEPTFSFSPSDNVELNFTNEAGVGANSSDDYLAISITGNPPWSGFGWRLASPYDVTTDANVVFKFYVNSSTSGDILIEFEDGIGGTKSAQISRSYVASEDWQEIIIRVSDITGGDGFNLADGVKNIVFVTGAGDKEFDIDEVQFAIVVPTDGEALLSAKENLEIEYTPGDNASGVTADVTLATSGDNEVAISWDSSDPTIIATDGTVTRASSNVDVTLTATLTKGSESETKEFIVTVIQDGVIVAPYCATEVTHFNIPAEVASAIRLTIANVDATTIAIEIESVDADPVDFLLINGSGATLSPVDANTIVVDGVIRTTLTYTDAPADLRDLGDFHILWSKDSTPGNSQLREADFGPLPFRGVCSIEELTDEEAVSAASNALVVVYAPGDDASSVTADVGLPTSLPDGVVATWESSDTGVISTDGTVNRQTTNTEITLTATIIKGIEEATKVFTVTVIQPPLTGNARVFADAAAVADVPLVSLTGTEPAGTAFVFNGGGAGDITRAVVSDNNGAFSSMNYLNVEEGGDGSGNGYAGFGWGFASYNMTAESNTAAKFLVRVAAGGPTRFGFVAEDGSGATQSRVVKSFIADGTWQTVIVTLAEFQAVTAEFDATDVRNIILSLDEALADSSTAINIDIDEVQFVITNIVATDGEAVLAASNALEIGYAPGDNVNSVTADVTLATSGADGVTISWASDNVAIATDGAVTRADVNTDVTLTATISKGIENATKVFTVTVLADGVAVATSGAGIIFADAAAVADVPLVGLTGTEPAGTAFGFSGGGVGDITRSLISDSDGAFSSTEYLDLQEGGDGVDTEPGNTDFAGTGWGFTSFDMTAVANTAVKFLVRSPAGGATSFGFVAQDGSGNTQSRVVKSFIADGNWQTVIVTLAEFQAVTAEFDATDVRNIILSLDEAFVTVGDIPLTIDIDEVQFVVTNIVATDGEAVLAASNALEIGYTAGDNASSVTADVTLLTSGADGVTISWASDNGAIATDGTVTRADVNTDVTLTATINKGTESVNKVFIVTVIQAPITGGGARIFADAASVVDVGQITVSEMGTYNGGGAGALTLIINSSDGDDSLEHLNVQESGDGAGNGFAGFNWQFSDNYSLTAEANTAVKFSVRVAAGGPTSFGVALETPGGVGDTRENQARKPVTFAADGTWQQVTIPISDFTSIANRNINAGGGLFRGNNFDPTSISVVVFSLDEALADSSTAINIDIDEVQFVITNIVATDGEAVLAASNALEIGYAPGDNVNSVTADVTLATSGADGVTISWASDNVAIATDGAVTRADVNTDVTLTATIIKGIENATKVFTVRVLADGVVITTNSGAARVFADAASVADVPLAPAATPIAFQYAENGGDWSVAVTSNAGDGAGSSDEYLAIRESSGEAAGSYAGFGPSVEGYNMTAVTNTALKFYARSSVVSNFVIEVEGPAGGGNKSPRVNVNFNSDGTWQEVVIPMSSFTGGAANLTTLGNLVFIFIDGAIPNVTEAVSVDIDEVQFVITNIVATDGEAVSAASNALEIGYTAGDDASSVTANVTLATSGADEVTITWASDNETVISTGGTVTRPTGANVVVTLTATISKGIENATKVFTVRVLADGVVITTNSGAARVFADAASVADVPLAPAATPIAFQYAENGGDWSVAVTSNAGDGAGSSDEYLAIRESSGEAAGSYAGFGPSVEGYNMTAVTNTALKFYARSSVVSNFVIEVEGPAGGGNKSPRVNVNFNSDGTWQEVVIPMSSFTGGAANLTTLGNLVFIFIDGAIPNVTEAVSVDIDEVQFVITNIVATDGEAVSAASNALEIGYTAGDDASSVTANVTLATSGADEVTISWESSVPAIISTVGTVNRQTTNAEITLTATLVKNGATNMKVFTVTVLADGVAVATSGAGIIFADAAAVADVPLVGLTGTEPAGTAFGFSGGGVGDITRSLISDSDGAFSSTDYLDIQEGGDGVDTDPNTDFAGTGWGFTSFDMTAVANTAVKFLVRSPAGGATSFGFVAADGSGATPSRVVKSFIADGTWQRVVVTTADFQSRTAEFDATDVRNIILSLDEAFVTVGDTPLTIDIDEVQFVVTNIASAFTDADRVAAAKSALEIIYTADDNASSVTADVTLPTSGADGVTISWASDNVAIATDGAVTRADVNTDVTLTATIIKGIENATKVFTVRVLADGVVITTNSGAARVFADAASVADVPLAPAATPIAFQYAENGGDWSVAVTSNAGDGAGSSDEYLAIRESSGEAAGSYAGFGPSVEGYNMTAVTNTALKFYARSSVVSNFVIEVEGPAGGGNKSPRVNVNFNSDGTWQEVVIPMSSFTGGAANLTTLGNLVFIFIDGAIPNVTEAVSVDIDEVQFVITNIVATDGEAVSAASNALEIIYTAGDNANSVTADVTLPTSGADGVTISWESSVPAIISTVGTVNRQTTNAEITLTATLVKNGATNMKVFTVTVIQPPLTGNARVFADAAAVAGVGQINVSNIIGTTSGRGAGALTLTVNSSDGDGSSEHLNVQEAGDGAGAGYAAFFWTFIDDYNLTAVTNTAVKFSVRVATGGPTSFGVALETTGASGDARPWQARKPVTFIADGTWQQVTIPASDFTSIVNRDHTAVGGLFRGNDFDPSTIQAVVFSLDEAVIASSTAINIDIDEVQFVITNIVATDGEAVSAAKSALEIIYTAGDNASSVTADVTLPTSGADGVGITWGSDNVAIATDGTVTRTNENTEVTLTATINKGTESVNKVFIVTVIQAPITGGGARIFADAASVVDVGQITVSEMGTYNGNGAGALTLTINSSDGDDSLEHLNVQESGDGAGNGFAGFYWQFSDNYSLTAEANTAVKFSVRVAAGGPTSFGVALETPGGVGDTRENQARKPVTFAADGTWQQVTIPISDFTSIANRDINAGGGLFRGNNFDPTSISVVVFSLDEAVADSSTAINIDIDEVQFVITNIVTTDADAVSEASNALEIGYTDGDNENSVTADVTLATSGENEVAISWDSSDPTIIATDGTVTRASSNVDVTLTATLEKNGVTDTKVFTVTVIK